MTYKYKPGTLIRIEPTAIPPTMIVDNLLVYRIVAQAQQIEYDRGVPSYIVDIVDIKDYKAIAGTRKHVRAGYIDSNGVPLETAIQVLFGGL